MSLMDSPTVTQTQGNGVSSPADAVKSASPLADSDAGMAPTAFHGLRRAATVNEGDVSRRRSGIFIPGNTESPFRDSRRRSSTFSDYSLSEARRNLDHDIINPGKAHEDDEDSSWSSLPLAFAIVPAIAGILFKNGSTMITDVLLLSLASVFLNWTITSPSKWYRSAQQVRVREENMVEVALEDSDEGELRSPEPTTPTRSGRLDDVPEEQPQTPSRINADLRRDYADQTRRALRELYMHEIVALFWCFVCPILGAYLLHAIRDQLTRTSEGLVSNFHLTIFVLAAEIWPCSRVIKLIMARTMHLQRVVAANPSRAETVTTTQMQEVLKRLEELEARGAANGTANGHATAGTTQNGNAVAPVDQGKQDAKIVREVRNLIQPELDALNRAVRRYEKKATVLAFQTESRMGALGMRLNDAIALAAAATKNNHSDWSGLAWVADRAVWAICLPLSALMSVALWPVRTVAGVFGYRNPRRERSRSKKRHSGSQQHWERERGSGSGSDMRRGLNRDKDRERGTNMTSGNAGVPAGGLAEKMMLAGQPMGPSSSSSSDRLFARLGKR